MHAHVESRQASARPHTRVNSSAPTPLPQHQQPLPATQAMHGQTLQDQTSTLTDLQKRFSRVVCQLCSVVRARSFREVHIASMARAGRGEACEFVLALGDLLVTAHSSYRCPPLRPIRSLSRCVRSPTLAHTTGSTCNTTVVHEIAALHVC